jgi:hypothetical protein
VNPVRRGACPGLADPMLTGDGLLARLILSTPMAVDHLCTEQQQLTIARERGADMVSRLGARRVVESIGGIPA